MSLCQCLQPIRHMSFVSFDSDSMTCTPLEAVAAFAFSPGTLWPALQCLRVEAKIKQGNKGDKEVCMSAGFGSKQLMDGVEIWGSASKTTEQVWTKSPRRDKAHRYRKWWEVSTPFFGSGGLSGYERQVGFVLKRKAIDEGKNRSLL